MTTTQLLLIIGAIYIAPHLPAFFSTSLGVFFIIYASCIGLGLI